VPFTRPTLADLIDRVRGDLRGRLEIGGALLRRAMADVLGTVWAGAVHTLYGYLDWIAKQVFADTAEREQLLRMAATYGITPVPAAYATGNVTATGTNGSSVLAGTILRLDAATSYSVVTGQVVAAGTATLPVIAVLAGAAGNLAASLSLSFETPVAGVNATTTVATGGIAGGVDEEGTEEVRDRFLLRLREPPEGGAEQDYLGWMLAVAGVTRAFVYPNELGLGTVVGRFMVVDPSDATAEVLPSGGQVTAVQVAVDAKRPITAVFTAAAPTSLSVAFTIHIVPDNADTRAAVTAELTDLLRRVAEPGDGAGRGTVLLSAIRTAIGIAEGVTDYTVTVPAANVVPTLGQLAKVGTITWT
jgi:uncharacterized phage protein gp47/JayE